MAVLTWDQVGERLYETGVNQGALYPQSTTGTYPLGVAWNGLTGVTESPSGAEATALYADNLKYLNLYSTEELGATIEAYTYPDEFALCNGEIQPTAGLMVGQQTRQAFGLVYKTLLGNDTQDTDYGYKLHLLYGCKASPSEKAYATVNDSPEAITFSWEVTTTPVTLTTSVDGSLLKPTSCLVIDSTKVDADLLAALEAVLYGSASVDPMLPAPDAVIAMMIPSED